ncbi:hypothetical protein ACFQS3_20435 [Glycomyces mayteni]|uniref:Uncharacterized protein n=1 Tax=Glycomyces mayteni TaxID=543887 RepID=A0ABW2DDB3_9ACTN|nr:hypothetical protein GCM10025732_06160 [Glycomyces mayteni]
MTMTTSSSSPQIHTSLDTDPPAPATAPPGPEALAQALQFETIPIDLLREHFTRWLVETLTQHRFPPAEGAPEAAVSPIPGAAPVAEPAAATGPARKPKRPSAGSRPPTRKREGPLADAIPPPLSSPPVPPPDSTPQPDPPASPEPQTGRPQYVRMGDKSVWLTKPMLRSRGWTEAAIRDFLPGPEALKPNPRFAVSGAPMPVWRPATVAKAESDPKWRAWLERSLNRRQTTLADLAETPDLEFRNRIELADQAIKECLAPPTLLESLEPAM